MRLSPYSLAVARAAEVAGGVNELAAQLGLSRVLVRACVTGSHATPTAVFLKVVDFLMDRDPVFLSNLPSHETPGGDSEALEPRRQLPTP